MNYRSEIDGLRAIAILPVIWIHSGLPYLEGGFLGVDVFFVISGFLITSILLREFETNKFSLTRFYERRARRILPALFAVIAITSVIVPLISSHPKFISDYGSSILSTIFFSSNIYFWQTSGYFGVTSELTPMLHTWSLAVEEQYYIFFPLLLMVLFSFGKKVIFCTLLFISFFSLLISEWGAVNSPIGNFYLLPSRVWELMAGGIAALFYTHRYLERIKIKYATYISSVGIALILISYFLFTPSTLHPTFLTLIPVFGAVLVLLFADKKNNVGKILSTKLLSIIGLMSYSLYLWHQPVLALMKQKYSVHLEFVQIILAITLIFTLSYVTWKYVENPFRNKRKVLDGNILKYSLISMSVLSLFGLLYKENFHIQKALSPADMARYKQVEIAEQSFINQVMFDSECRFWSNNFNDSFISRFDECATKYDKAIFILGGSHGMDLYNAIALNSPNPFIVSVSRGYCRAHKFINPPAQIPKCQYEDFKLFASSYSNNISAVLYTQAPYRLFNPTRKEVTIKDLSLKSVDEVVDYLVQIKEKNSLNVMMIGMLPSLKVAPMSWDLERPFEQQFEDIVSKNNIFLSTYLDRVFSTKLEEYEIPYISKTDGFNLKLPEDLIIDGDITYSDKTHISHAGEKIFGKRLINHLTNLGYEEFNKVSN